MTTHARGAPGSRSAAKSATTASSRGTQLIAPKFDHTPSNRSPASWAPRLLHRHAAKLDALGAAHVLGLLRRHPQHRRRRIRRQHVDTAACEAHCVLPGAAADLENSTAASQHDVEALPRQCSQALPERRRRERRVIGGCQLVERRSLQLQSLRCHCCIVRNHVCPRSLAPLVVIASSPLRPWSWPGSSIQGNKRLALTAVGC